MSNRYAHNRPDPVKSSPKTQKTFVPKQQGSAPRELPATANPSLSGSLRHSRSQQSTASAAASSGSRIRVGDGGDWVSSRDNGGSFVNYLPQDEAVAVGFGAEDGGLDPVESQRVVDLLNRELSRLLKLNPRDFWREVARDVSLHDFLDSFLQFRSRWYDFPHRGAKGTVAGVIVGEFELSRRVFLILYRLSSNKDPGAQASESLNLNDHEVLLQEKKLLDLPKLLDICAIYGHENPDLTRQLVLNAVKSQPWIQDELIAVICHFMSIVSTIHQRCDSSLEALLSSGAHKECGSNQLLTDFLEVMDFTNDAVVCMNAFISAYKPAAVFFSCPVEMGYGNEELLSTLARLHDLLIPSLERAFEKIFATRNALHNTSRDTLANVALSVKMLSKRLSNFGWTLLEICYLSGEVFDGSFPLPAAMKMFPANVQDPVIRADILVQTFRGICGGITQLIDGGHTKGTFLQNVEKDFGIMSRLEILRDARWISLDDEQFNYLSSIMAHPDKSSTKNSSSALTTSLSSNNPHVNEDSIILESKVSQIRDLFPDYGKGFLLACLDVYNQNTEDVIQRILEGTLHEDLQALDTSLEEVPPPKANVPPNMSQKDKGKGKVSEFIVLPPAGVADVRKPTNEALPLSSSTGRFIRKPKDNLTNVRILDSRDEWDAQKTAALASQYEYEDEYDDSFDDLGLSVGDMGLEETEILGEKIYSGPSAGTQSAPHPSNSSKWNSRKKPEFYVKDGKNYSYKVAGSVAVANRNEAALVNLAQKESIHGLGRGGNLPLGAVKKLTELSEERDEQPEVGEVGGRGNRVNGRGTGGRRGGRNNYRKDQAFKKHFSGLGGH